MLLTQIAFIKLRLPLKQTLLVYQWKTKTRLEIALTILKLFIKIMKRVPYGTGGNARVKTLIIIIHHTQGAPLTATCFLKLGWRLTSHAVYNNRT